MTREEHLAKMRAARTNIRKPNPTILEESFEFRGEAFERLYYDSERQIAVFRRTNPKVNKLIAYEVVTGKGPDLKYPGDNDFGTYGYCYTGSDERCKKSIKDMHGIVL